MGHALQQTPKYKRTVNDFDFQSIYGSLIFRIPVVPKQSSHKVRYLLCCSTACTRESAMQRGHYESSSELFPSWFHFLLSCVACIDELCSVQQLAPFPIIIIIIIITLKSSLYAKNSLYRKVIIFKDYFFIRNGHCLSIPIMPVQPCKALY